MAIKLISVKCPDCGATLSIEEGRKSAFCSYCGAKVLINNENEHIYRNIDEAKIREAETDRMIKLRQLEIEEKSNFSKKTMIIIWLSATALLFLIGIVGWSVKNEGMEMCFLIGFNIAMWGGIGLFASGNRNNRIIAGSDEAVITRDMIYFREKNFNSMTIMFRGAGFSNVTAVPLNDLNIFTQGKNGQVESITINGNSNFRAGDIYPKNSRVLITYHSR